MTTSNSIPLSSLLPLLEESVQLHVEFLQQLSGEDNVLDSIGLAGYHLSESAGRATVGLDLTIAQTLVLELPGLLGFALVAGNDQGETAIGVDVDVGDPDQDVLEARITGAVAVRAPQALLRPARLESRRWRPVPDGFTEFVCTATLHLDPSLNVWLDAPTQLDLEPTMIGETGIVISAAGVELSLAGASPEVFITSGTLHLPEDLTSAANLGLLPEFSFHDVAIDARGFSGSIAADWPLEYDDSVGGFVYRVSDPSGTGETLLEAKLFGLEGGLRHVGVSFEQNRLTAVDISGQLLVPYFEEPVDVRINVVGGGELTITLLGVDDDGITLTKEELLALSVKSLSIASEQGHTSLVVSGGLQPLIMGGDGLEWPRLDVTDLYIDSDGTFRIREAWLDLKELATLDLWGFHLELSRVGLGYLEAADKLWVDLSGSLRLIDQIPVGLGVEGFRIIWPRDPGLPSPPTLDDLAALAPQIGIEFAGIYLFYGIPDAVEFEGFIRFIKTDQMVGFAGDMALRVPASGFAAEAGLMVGMNFEAPPYPFLYVYFGVELPAGIPLGQSGLALKGALGMFGLNVTPDKTPEQNWYYDWYKRGPIVGAHPTNKWRPERMALALGVGVTITTADGYIKGTRGLLVLAIPGPILLIEGRALILDVLPNSEPPLRALAVFDGREQVAQFNLEAEAELVPDLLRAYGMLEAFFDFKDLTNWHLYLGQDEPPDRRIQANIFKLNSHFLFDANAYLMVDMVGAQTVRSRMGFLVGFEPPLPELPPLEIKLDATLEGTGLVTILPEQLSGDVLLSANASIKAFDFGVQVAASGEVLTEGPDPFKVEADLTLEAELPWPLDPFETSIHFAWQSPRPPEIEPPLAAVVADSDFVRAAGALALSDFVNGVNGGGALALLGGQRDTPLDAPDTQQPALDSPSVALDARPTLAFGHDMNVADAISDLSGGDFAGHPGSASRPHSYDVGQIQITPSLIVSGVRLTPTLTKVELLKHRKRGPWNGDDSDWTRVATTASGAPDAERFWGTWLAEATPDDPTVPAVRRLRLWTANPFDHARGASGIGSQSILGLPGPRHSYVDGFLESYPDYFDCKNTKPEPTCVHFRDADGSKLHSGNPWAHEGLTFTTDGQMELKISPGRRLKPVPRGLVTRLELLHESESAVCLLVHGSLHMRFPEPVRTVQVRFCTKPEASANDVRRLIAVRRTPRAAPERARVEHEARAKGIPPDYQACVVPVAFEVIVHDREWTITGAEPFECLDWSRPATPSRRSATPPRPSWTGRRRPRRSAATTARCWSTLAISRCWRRAATTAWWCTRN